MSENADIIIKSPDLPVIEIVDNLAQVYKEYMAVKAALKLKLFDWMDKNGPSTPEEISVGTGILSEYIKSLLGTLYYLDMVRRSGDKFSISPSASMHFVTSSSLYQGSYIINCSSPNSSWAKLDSILIDSNFTPLPELAYPDFIRSDAEQSVRGMVQNVTNVVSRWSGFSRSESLLEINGGHGLYAIAACQINDNLQATVCSSSESLIVLEEYSKRYGIESRIKSFTNDIFSKTPSDKFDIIVASHSLYSVQEDLSRILVHVAGLLKEGGLFVSNHWFKGSVEGTGMQGLYELDLALNSRFHMIRDREVFEEECNKSNLKIFQSGIIRSAYGESTIHMAEKRMG